MHVLVHLLFMHTLYTQARESQRARRAGSSCSTWGFDPRRRRVAVPRPPKVGGPRGVRLQLRGWFCRRISFKKEEDKVAVKCGLGFSIPL